MDLNWYKVVSTEKPVSIDILTHPKEILIRKDITEEINETSENKISYSYKEASLIIL